MAVKTRRSTGGAVRLWNARRQHQYDVEVVVFETLEREEWHWLQVDLEVYNERVRMLNEKLKEGCEGEERITFRTRYPHAKRLGDDGMQHLIWNLERELNTIRESLCQDAVENAKIRCAKWGIKVERRIRRRQMMPDELARDGLSAEEEIVRVLRSSLDRLEQEIATCFTRLKNLHIKFGFLLNVEYLFKTENAEICQNCTVCSFQRVFRRARRVGRRLS
jgi:hypothetical protein